jgi:hypothetical protein
VGLTPVDDDRWELRSGPILLARLDCRGRLVHPDPPPHGGRFRPVDVMDDGEPSPTRPRAQQRQEDEPN